MLSNIRDIWDWDDCPIGLLSNNIKQALKENFNFFKIVIIFCGVASFFLLWAIAYFISI